MSPLLRHAPSNDGPAVRVRAERDRFVGFVLDGVASLSAEPRLRGRARLLEPGSLRVGEHPHVQAGAVVVANGSHPVMLRALGTDASVTRVWRQGDRVFVARRQAGAEVVEDYAYALCAVGRSPNLEGLDLARAGARLDGRGRPAVDPHTLQVDGLPLFLAGDATGDRALLHEAADEGRIAGDNAATWPALRPGARGSTIGIVFSDPQLAVVGQGWAGLQQEDVVVGAVDLSDQGRSRVMRENRGWLHLYADRENGPPARRPSWPTPGPSTWPTCWPGPTSSRSPSPRFCGCPPTTPSSRRACAPPSAMPTPSCGPRASPDPPEPSHRELRFLHQPGAPLPLHQPGAPLLPPTGSSAPSTRRSP